MLPSKKNPIIIILTLFVLFSLLPKSGHACLPQNWREHVYQSPTIDTTTTKASVIKLPIKLRLKANRTIDEIISTDRCGLASLGPSLDPYELNPPARRVASFSSSKRRVSKHQQKQQQQPRIINGERANPNSWPWLVRIYIRQHDDSNFRCAGSLIDKRFVLTSAYCVHGVPIQHMFVAAGSSDMTSGGKTYAVETVRIPDDYSNDATRKNDIAIVKLKRPVMLSPTANTICLPQRREARGEVYNKNVVVAGWGSTDGVNSPSSLSKNLIQVIMTVFKEKAACEREEKYCAYKPASKNANVCWHDLGAPLMYFAHNRWHVYGVASLFEVNGNTQECNPSMPSYYTIVPEHVNWIGYELEKLQGSYRYDEDDDDDNQNEDDDYEDGYEEENDNDDNNNTGEKIFQQSKNEKQRGSQEEKSMEKSNEKSKNEINNKIKSVNSELGVSKEARSSRKPVLTNSSKKPSTETQLNLETFKKTFPEATTSTTTSKKIPKLINFLKNAKNQNTTHKLDKI